LGRELMAIKSIPDANANLPSNCYLNVRNAMQSRLTQPHAQTSEECLSSLGAPATGLFANDAKQRLTEYGPNHLPEEPRRPALVRFLLHFHNVLMYVLLGAAAVTAALGHMIDTWVILAVVLVNAVMGFIQEGRAENAMAAIRQMAADECG